MTDALAGVLSPGHSRVLLPFTASASLRTVVETIGQRCGEMIGLLPEEVPPSEGECGSYALVFLRFHCDYALQILNCSDGVVASA